MGESKELNNHIKTDINNIPESERALEFGLNELELRVAERTEALRESERKIRAIFDQTFQFIGMMTPDGTLIEANRTAMQFAGINESDCFGKLFWDTPWWTHSAEMQNKLRETVIKAARGETVRFEATHLAADGNIRYIDFSLKPVKDETGKVIFLIPEGRDITERKKAEEILKRERDNLSSIFEVMNDGVYIVDHQYDIQYVNRVLQEEYGSWKGVKCYTYFHDRTEICPWCPNQKVFAGETVRWEWYSEKNGKTYDLIDTPLRGPDGSILKLEIFRDITERKHAEKEIVNLSKFPSENPNPVLRIAEDGTILYSNKAGLELLANWGAEIGEKAPERWCRLIKEKFDSGKTGSEEEEEEEDKTFSIIIAPVKAAGYANFYARDITKRKRAEKALRESEVRHKEMLIQAAEGIAAADFETMQFRYVNPSMCRMFGYTEEELTRLGVEDIHPKESLDHVLAEFEAQAQGEKTLTDDLPCLRKDDTLFYANVSATPTVLDGHKCLVGFFTDNTERKQVESQREAVFGALRESERKLKELVDKTTRSQEALKASYTELKMSKDNLVRSEKLAFTGRIAASIAHEIRNPLTNVSMSVRQLKKGGRIKHAGLKHSEIIERNVERINFLITELLNCARPAKLNPQLFDIHQVINDALNSDKTKITLQKIKVTKLLSAKSSILKIDKEHMGRVFLNLITNAIDAMPRGGNLTISTEINKDIFLVKVQDTGKGIPEKDIIKIFDPFFSTKSQGVGLGLTTCYGIIVSHGGTIGVESKWRKGTTFIISLPIEHTQRERERERE